MITQILLDQDGVLADFHTACLTVHCRRDLIDSWPEGSWAMDTVMGISPEEFWKPVDNYGFWRHMVMPFPGAREFYTELKKIAPVTISTTPSESSDCAKAKIEWLREYIDPDIQYMLGGKKWLMAKPEHLLIDDYDRNVNLFRSSGGAAMLLPRIWNSQWQMASSSEQAYSWMFERVDGIVKLM